jgi:cobalt-zinc-cadmium efflux system outer membrane protein
MRHASVVVLALALAGPAGAQQPPLSPRQALELARLHSPLLSVAESRIRVAVGAARQRAAPPNPLFEMRQENMSGALATDRFATLTLPLGLTFQRGALRAEGRETVAAVTADSASTARAMEATVATLYWRSALAEALVGSAAIEAAAMQEIATLEETRLLEGAVAEGVALRARLEVERARLALARAGAEARRAHAALALAIGLPAGELGRPAAPEVGASVGVPDLAGSVARAIAERPEMEAARRRVEAARWGVRAAWRGTLPDAGVQIGAMQTAGRGAALVGIAIELPLRDRGAAARERARGEQALAEAELEVARGRVAAEVAAAIEVYVRLVEAAPAESFALAERGAEVARIAGTAYREGAVSLMELLDAQRAHADARTTAATWAAELAMARIELCRALGAPIEEAL